MNKIFADRFKSARLLNGMSLQDLANSLDNKISRQSLHRYEKGEVVPEKEMIKLLSQTLNVEPDFFFKDTKVEIGKVEFRILKNLSSKEESKVIEQTKEYLSRYLEIEEILGLQKEFQNPLSEFSKITSYEQINEAANKLRESWDLGNDPIFNVVNLLEEKNIKVVKVDAELEFDGLQTWVNGLVPVVAYNEKKSEKKDRIRFTLLHELAHLLLDFGDITVHQKETLCHQFAGAMLLPDTAIRKELGEKRNQLSIPELGNIKLKYGISLQAIVMRAKACNIINEHYTKQFFFMMKQMNWTIDEPIQYKGAEQNSNRLNQLINRALAESLISVSKAAELSNQSIEEFQKSSFIFR